MCCWARTGGKHGQCGSRQRPGVADRHGVTLPEKSRSVAVQARGVTATPGRAAVLGAAEWPPIADDANSNEKGPLMQQAELTPWPQSPDSAPVVGAEFRPNGRGRRLFAGAAIFVGVVAVGSIWLSVAWGRLGTVSVLCLVLALVLLWVSGTFYGRKLVVRPAGLVRQGMGAPKLFVPWDRLATVVLVPSVQTGTDQARAYLYFLDQSGKKIALLFSPVWDTHTMQELANNVPPVQRYVVSQPIKRKQLKGIPGYPGLSKQL